VSFNTIVELQDFLTLLFLQAIFIAFPAAVIGLDEFTVSPLIVLFLIDDPPNLILTISNVLGIYIILLENKNTLDISMDDYITLVIGGSIKISSKGILNIITCSDSVKVTKTNREYILECVSYFSTRIKIIYKNLSTKIIGILIDSKEPSNIVKIGMKNIVGNEKIIDFLNSFDNNINKNINCLYYNCYDNYLEDYLTIINNSLKLGIRDTFLIINTEIDIPLIMDFIYYNIKKTILQFYLIIKQEKIKTINKLIEYKGISICLGILPDEIIDLEIVSNNNINHIAYDIRNTKDYTNDNWLDLIAIIKNNNISNNKQNILYNIPPGHPNDILEINTFTNKKFPEHTNTVTDYSSSATMFFFGGIVSKRQNQNIWNDSITEENEMTIFPDHIKLCIKYNINFLLFGPSNKYSTTNIPWIHSVNRVTDSMYTLSKIKTIIKTMFT
jgi:hypothetical protein